MATLIKLFRNTLLLFCICLYAFCSATNTKPEIVLIGSTPGDELVKTMLAIPSEAKIDFIRWNLILNENNSFILDINYGESQPNALGFKGDEKKTTIKGTFSVSESSNYKEVYHLKSADLSIKILIAKLNENIFHLLTSQHQMMVGNGGWSYTLNRKEPIPNEEISITSTITDYKSLQLVYDGRTPCQEIGNEHPEMKVTPSCFKIKWRLILNRDAVTYKPTTCSIRNIVNNQPRDISGKWEIIKGTKTNPNAIIYKIIVSNLAEPILLFAVDDNVLFFIDKDKKPMVGNKDFSFTLNKKSQ
ncbi:hypothetical protein [Flavobacterium granuli]|uniref:Lipocalin-like domain-containing protein n=1 Tax=Flavobacterium granuli TaxID=280093 RepID=A0ABU1S5Q3_9FLAO|nr:hypothetical protein [Flavobacterium granuli]MDR6845540.1 hypothetical protein [Flavobacterium granuli]